MKLSNKQFYISSISKDCIDLSKKYNFGIEITDFSYAENMDTYYEDTKKNIEKYIDSTSNVIFHAPFYELSMASIDSKVKSVTFDRLNQFYKLTKMYNPKKLVFHSGYLPNVYYKEWFLDNAVNFLNDYIKDKDIVICLENVFSDTPDFIYHIVSKVNNDKLKICLDIGHINAYSHNDKLSPNENVKYWIDELSQYINHIHIHNNYGDKDLHQDAYDGDMDIKDLIIYANSKVNDITFTVEVMNINDFPKLITDITGETI